MAAVINEGILWRESPNFFELLAEETLREALRPALHYLCKVSRQPLTAPPTSYPMQVLARYRPHRFSLLWRSRDEVHLLLDSALQLLFLRTCGQKYTSPKKNFFFFFTESSFSEHFYGLKRVCVKRGGFSSRNVFTSFFFLVRGFPSREFQSLFPGAGPGSIPEGENRASLFRSVRRARFHWYLMATATNPDAPLEISIFHINPLPPVSVGRKWLINSK